MFKHNETTNKRSGWTKLIMIIIPAVVIFAGVSFYAVNQWYEDNLQPISSVQAEDVAVVIQNGSSVRDIADQLKELGVIRNSTVFSWYIGRQNPVPSLQAGTYRLNPGQTVEEIVASLSSGDVATNLYTIIPGLRLDQLQEDFMEFGFTEDEVNSAINARYDDHPLFKDLPVNASLEGYIFPETYEITVDSSVKDILLKSFDEFNEQLTPELRKKLTAQGLNIHQAITLSSIIEKESLDVADQSKISQVFLSRLEQDIVLGSDVTYIYAAEVTGQAAVPSLDHPYNTRLYGGLPPGPISNFNLTALQAAANPASTTFLYFVAGDNGTTYFSSTLAEHESLAAQYCIELCRL